MHHLQHAVVERGGARHVAELADRQELLQIVLARVEIGQRDVAGLVAGIDLIRRARTVRRRRAMAVDRHRHGHDRVGHDVAQLRPRAAVDRAGRQMEQEIDDARRLALEQPREQLLELRPDAGQAGQRGEQRIEHRRAHGSRLSGAARANTALARTMRSPSTTRKRWRRRCGRRPSGRPHAPRPSRRPWRSRRSPPSGSR